VLQAEWRKQSFRVIAQKHMPLLRKNRRGEGQLRNQAFALSVAVAVLLAVGSVTSSPAQLPKSIKLPAKAEPTVPAKASLDPLGRETPRSAMIGFLRYEQSGDFDTAARFLQFPPGQHTNLAQLAKEIRRLYQDFQGNINLLSDDPNGSVEPGLPLGQARAGVVTVGGTTADVILVRVDDPVAGKIWLISRSTVASIPKLYDLAESVEPTRVGRLRLALLTGPSILGMSSTQWLFWLLSIPLSWLLAWLLTFLVSAPRRAWCKLRRHPFTSVWHTPVGIPLRCMIALLLHACFVYLLQPPLLYRVYYSRFLAAVLVVCFGWLMSRISDQGFNHALNQTRTHRKGGESILILMQRMNRVGVFVIAMVAALAILGLNVTTTLAGLGIGGLAVALAAQKTLENLIGGVSLLMDRAIQVGDFCKIGDRMGTVEDIGLRSLKMRTLDQNLLVVPNGALAQMQFENMKVRPKLLISQNFFLRIETRIEQLRFVLESVQKVLDDDPAIESGTSRVRVTNFEGAAFQLELFAYGKTSDWTQLTAIRQEILFKIVGIVEAAGTGFAAHTQLTYQSKDPGLDPEKVNDLLRHVTELRASEALQLSGKARTGTN
jgi:MscS family membrane protein